VGTGHYIYKVYNYHDSQACSYKQSGILSRLDGFGMVLGMVWFGYGFHVVFVEVV
jgi:hypothetical protein